MKVTLICFNSSLYKYLKKNISLPVTEFDGTFLTNFNFDNMFVFDFSGISLDTKNLILLTGGILILFRLVLSVRRIVFVLWLVFYMC